MKWWDDVKQDLRRAHKSLTLWVNGAVAAAWAALLYLADNTDALTPVADVLPDLYKYAVAGLAAYNFYRRFKTTSALRDK